MQLHQHTAPVRAQQTSSRVLTAHLYVDRVRKNATPMTAPRTTPRGGLAAELSSSGISSSSSFPSLSEGGGGDGFGDGDGDGGDGDGGRLWSSRSSSR